MTREEKIQYITSLLALDANAIKLIVKTVLENIPNVPESKLDDIITKLTT